jgi:hypothetical protein
MAEASFHRPGGGRIHCRVGLGRPVGDGGTLSGGSQVDVRTVNDSDVRV